MTVEFHSLRLAGHLDLGLARADRLHLCHGSGRGARLSVPVGWLSLWLPLFGELPLESACSRWQLPRSHLLVARETGLDGGSREAACWLVLAGPPAAWSHGLQGLPESVQPNEVLPRQWPCPRVIRRGLVRMARQARSGTGTEATLRALCAALLDEQRALQPWIDRCNGRTPQRRRITLQRLLRVRLLIERDPDRRLDLHRLARSANYSPWHLIRMYRDVFGETPSEHLARLRLARAWSLVRDTALPISEVTMRLGFESQSAFCRAFKNAYGLTTTQVRGLQAPASGPSLRPSHGRRRTRPPQTQPLSARR